MKKNTITLLLLAALAVLAYFALQKKNSTGTFTQFNKNFYIEDTASITKIMLANKNGEKIELNRISEGSWQVNDKYLANQANIGILLKTINRTRIKSPVPKAMHDNAVRSLASTSTKVEIYTKQIKDEPKLVYYVGEPAKDFKGTFMIAERNGVIADKPFINEIPGFNGYLSVRYHTNLENWRDRSVFKYNPENIQRLTVNYPRTPEQSFIIERIDDRNYSLNPLNEEVASAVLKSNLDPQRISDYLNEFRSKGAEAIDNDHAQRDSVSQSIPFAEYDFQFMDGTENKTNIYFMPINDRSRVHEDEQGNLLNRDIEHYFGLMNDGRDFVIIQDLVFHPVFRGYTDFFLKAGETLEN